MAMAEAVQKAPQALILTGLDRTRQDSTGLKMADEERTGQSFEHGRGPRPGGPRSDSERPGGEGRGGERGGMRRRPGGGRRKVCRFCADKSLKVDYKDVRTL